VYAHARRLQSGSVVVLILFHAAAPLAQHRVISRLLKPPDSDTYRGDRVLRAPHGSDDAPPPTRWLR
jgi:hypothetical protein